MSEERQYRQEKKKYKDENIKFAEEGRRYKPKKKRRIRIMMLSVIAVALAVAVLIAVFVFGDKNTKALSDNMAAALETPAVLSAAPERNADSPAPQQSTSASPVATAIDNAPAVSPAAAEASNMPPTEVNIMPPAAAPLVYENDGQVMMANGGKRITLGSRGALYGSYESINAALSGDNRYLYYLNGFDSITGMGTLMKAAADASSEPVSVAEGVCAAKGSYDGNQVMYFKNMQGAVGSLYVFTGGQEELIAENAVPDFFEFSPGGQCISYFTQESDGTKALYMKSIGAAPVLITHITAEATLEGGVSLTRVSAVMPFDNGDVLYSAEENYNMPLYLFTHGSVNKICDDGYVVKAFTDGGFLYGETGLEAKPLWYKAPGGEPVMLSENYDYVKFPDDEAGSAWFLLVERIGDGADDPGVMMYVISDDKIKAAISLADSEGIEINNSFDCVTYERDEKLYASRRTDGGWKETFLSDASSQEFQGARQSGMHAQFDETGANLYYSDEIKTGPLYRFSVKDGSITKLVNKVDWFRVIGDTAYAHTTDDKLYRCMGGMQMTAAGVRELYAVQGGAYAVTDDGLLFIGSGAKAKNAGSFTDDIEIDAIDYHAPLEQDTAAALDVLAREADYCLYKLGYFRDKCEQPIEPQSALALAGKLLAKEGLEADEKAILQKMYDGLNAFVLWTNGDGGREDAKDALENASASYESYVNASESGEG